MTPAYAALGFREWQHDHGALQTESAQERISVQKLAVRLLEWACCAGASGDARMYHQIAETHHTYKLVTEGRDSRAGKPDPNYSSCGDLAHWLLYRMGVRDARVNRAEYMTSKVGNDSPRRALSPNYNTGANVSRLTQWLPRAAPNAGTTLDAAPGDILIIRGAPGTEHVMCVIDRDAYSKDTGYPASRLWTAEYGQPGGALRTRDVALRVERADCGRACACPDYGSGLYIGRRRILYHIRLLDVLAEARAAGRLVSAEEPPA